MSNIKWAGTPCGYTRSRAKSKRVDRWKVGAPVQREAAPSMGAEYWLGVIGVFTACITLMVWAALAAA